MNIQTQFSTDYITSEMNDWMRRRYARLKQDDVANSTNTASVNVKDDFGQIHFAKNDRKSWYVRFPFSLPTSDKTVEKPNQPQQNSVQHQQAEQPPSTSKSKIPKKNIIASRYDDSPQAEDEIVNEEDSEIEEQENAVICPSIPSIDGENNDGSTDPQLTQTNHPPLASEVPPRKFRSTLLETFNENDDCEKNVTEDKTTMSQAAEIVDFMRNAWKLPVPELVISVTGGAKFFEIISPRAHKTFQQDLVSAAMATNAWVFTGGTCSGVIKEVGDAYDKCRYKNTKTASKIPYIGVVSWYATTDYQQLEQNRYKLAKKNDSDDSTLFTKGSTERECLYRTRQPSDKEKPETYPLDHNHTHFLMLEDEFGKDDEKRKKSEYRNLFRTDLILDIRAEIEEASRKITNQGQTYSIPIVQILVHGGVSSILTVCASIKRNTPVIVINGSGRAANLIAFEYNYLYGKNKVRSLDEYNAAKKTPQFLDYEKKGHFGSKSEESIIKSRNRPKFIEMMRSIRGYFLLNSYELFDGNTQSRLDDAIMETQLNAALMTDDKREQQTKKLRLAIAWNKYDRVANDILTNKTASAWSDVDLDDALRNALRRNSINFTDILIAYGASFQRLRRLINITDLYKDLDNNALQANLPVVRNKDSTIMSLVEMNPLLPDKLDDLTSNKDKIQRNDMQSDYYTTYFGKKITIHHSYIEQMTRHSSTDNRYGIIDHYRKTKSFFNGMLVFSYNDIIRKSGHVTEISINFSKLPNDSRSIDRPSIFLYVISTTKEEDQFVIIHRYQMTDAQIQQLLNNEIKSERHSIDDSNIRTITLREPTLYLEAGQFLGIGFGHYSGHPYRVKSNDSYYIDLNTANNALDTGQPQLFIRQAIYCVTFSFTIRPASNFIRDLLLWSLFVDRSNVATCLCSHSENTIVATLLSSKIYRIAAEIEYVEEKKEDYLRKAGEFDNHAAQIIEACYHIKEDFAVEILTADSKLYFGYSPLQLAKENNSRSFLATKCVHKYLDKQWYGEVNNHGHASYFIDLLILFLCIIPPAIPIAAKLSRILALKKEEHEPTSASEWSVVRFYRRRAIIRFYYNIMFYIAFLGLFSFVLLVDYFPRNNNNGKRNGFTNIEIPLTEMFVHIGMLSVVVEEFVEFGLYYDEKSAYNSRSILWKYFADDRWNILDIVAILFYLVGFATRFVVSEPVFAASKIFMCIALFLWYVRILHLFVASERLGTKLLMIFNTMKDLLFFVCFILIFLIGYSVTSYSLVTTKHQVLWDDTFDNSPSTTYKITNDGSGLWNWSIIRNVIDWGMWKIYGQVELLDHSQVDGTTLNADNDAYGVTVFILTIIFVCIANVLLLNVLVALFNVTLEKTKDHAHISWAYHRFLLVNEYSKKSPLPPPLNLLYYSYKLIKYLIIRHQNKSNNHIYGSLDNKSELDSNIYDTITFNAMDQVRVSGTISTISINFSTAPDTEKPKIRLFVLMAPQTASSPNTFRVIRSRTLKTDIENIKRKGIQKFHNIGLPIIEGAYLGIRFSAGAGNPFSTERNQYYCYFDDTPYTKQCLEFTRCQTKGIAMSFEVVPKTGISESNQLYCLGNRKKEMKSSHKQHRSFSANRHTYRTYDNMLREQSIAHDYWTDVIDRLKKEEKDANKQYSAQEALWKQVTQLVQQPEKNPANHEY